MARILIPSAESGWLGLGKPVNRSWITLARPGGPTGFRLGWLLFERVPRWVGGWAFFFEMSVVSVGEPVLRPRFARVL